MLQGGAPSRIRVQKYICADGAGDSTATRARSVAAVAAAAARVRHRLPQALQPPYDMSAHTCSWFAWGLLKPLGSKGAPFKNFLDASQGGREEEAVGLSQDDGGDQGSSQLYQGGLARSCQV